MKATPTAEMIREALGSGKEEPPERKPLLPGGEEPVEWGGVSGVPFRTLLAREVRRFVLVWTQTLLAPLLTSALYILVFGYGLGSRIREAAGFPYLEFILPGLVLMSIITGSYGNTSTNLFDAKRERYIDDVLISPMSDLQMALAYALGGVPAVRWWARAPSPWPCRWPGSQRSTRFSSCRVGGLEDQLSRSAFKLVELVAQIPGEGFVEGPIAVGEGEPLAVTGEGFFGVPVQARQVAHESVDTQEGGEPWVRRVLASLESSLEGLVGAGSGASSERKRSSR